MTVLPAVHVPERHVSLESQALPSLHEVPSATVGLLQTPVAGLHVPATWHWSDAVHVTLPAAVQSARLASIVEVAGVPVVARRAIGNRGVRALARAWVARARHVALVGCRARDRASGDAGAGLACVVRVARVSVTARRSIGKRRVRALPRARVARARAVALVGCRARDGASRRARSRLACVVRVARVSVVAGGAVRDARVGRRTHRRLARRTRVRAVGCAARDACAADGAEAGVEGRGGARPGGGVARAGRVARVRRRARDVASRRARTRLAGVVQVARVAVAAGRAVRDVRVRGRADGRLARLAGVGAVGRRRTRRRLRRWSRSPR